MGTLRGRFRRSWVNDRDCARPTIAAMKLTIRSGNPAAEVFAAQPRIGADPAHNLLDEPMIGLHTAAVSLMETKPC